MHIDIEWGSWVGLTRSGQDSRYPVCQVRRGCGEMESCFFPSQKIWMEALNGWEDRSSPVFGVKTLLSRQLQETETCGLGTPVNTT